MARTSNAKRVTNAIDALKGSTGLGALADLLESFAVIQNGENIADIEDATVSASKRKKRKAKDEDDKPARRKSKKRASKDDDDDDKPARKRRKSKDDDDDEDDEKPKRTRKSKVEAFDEEPTAEDVYKFLETFEGEPVDGGIRELKPQVEELGADVAELLDGVEGRAEKAETLGLFIAAHNAAHAKLMKHDIDDLEELAEELDVEMVKQKKKLVDAILEAIHAGADDDEDEDDSDEDADEEEDEDEDDEEEDDDADQDEKPARKRKSKKSKKSDDDDDDKPARRKKRKAKDEDDDDDKPRKKKGKKSKKSKDDDDELSDLDDIE